MGEFLTMYGIGIDSHLTSSIQGSTHALWFIVDHNLAMKQLASLTMLTPPFYDLRQSQHLRILDIDHFQCNLCILEHHISDIYMEFVCNFGSFPITRLLTYLGGGTQYDTPGILLHRFHCS